MVRVLAQVGLLVALTALPSGCRRGASESPVVISEFVASNGDGLRDGDGETSDWVELHNRSAAAVDLEGWRLTDDRENLERWRFPSVSLPADGYLVVFASGKAQSSTPGELHASFRLKASEDYLGLLYPSGRVAHEFAPYPGQRSDVSYGSIAGNPPTFMQHPTPGAPNTPNGVGEKQSTMVPADQID